VPQTNFKPLAAKPERFFFGLDGLSRSSLRRSASAQSDSLAGIPE